MNKTVCLVGASALPVGKHQKPREAEIQVLERELMAKVIIDAVADAGITKSEIGSLIFGIERDYPKQRYFSTFMANYLRLPTTGSVLEVVGNGMTGGYAFDKAADEVALGRSRVALACGINMESAIPTGEHLNNSMRHTGDVDYHTPSGFMPISWYAMDATRYMHDFGVTRREIAGIAVKNRHHASLNPIAQYRKPITIEDVLAQRLIVEPLGLYDVPGRGDGAVCLVLADEDTAVATGKPYLRLKGRGFYHEGAHQISEVPNDMTAFVSAQKASAMAYEEAGITVEDLDLAEVYAPCSIVEVLASEALGLVERGRGAHAAYEGETALGGRIPICTSGGCLSRGHPPFTTGLYNFVELADQLRGRAGERQVANARLALAASELGNYNAALVHVMEAVQ